MSTVLVTPPATEPVTTTEVKAQLSITGTDHDTRIGRLISLAREYVENYTGRALITQTWNYFGAGFPNVVLTPKDYFENVTATDILWMPKAPLISVTTVKYTDEDGVQQTLNASLYTVVSNSDIGYIIPAYDETWPDTRLVPNAIEIQFVAGYGAAASVPQPLRHAILLLIGNWFENTEEAQPFNMNQIPFGVAALLDQYRIWSV